MASSCFLIHYTAASAASFSPSLPPSFVFLPRIYTLQAIDMRFLLDFVSCCGPVSRPSCPLPKATPPPSPPPPPPVERRSLVTPPPPDSRLHRGRKRGRSAGGSRSGSATEWRPSLHAISEDNVLPETKERRSAVHAGSERILKRKLGSTTRSHIRNRLYSDDYGRAPSAAILPAFSPTPFLF